MLSLSMLPGMGVILQVSRRRCTLLIGLGALLLLLVLGGCGGGGGSSSVVPPTQTGTPPGTYTVTVSGTASSVTHSYDLKLTVN